MKKSKKKLQKAFKQIQVLKPLLQWQSAKIEALKEEIERYKRKYEGSL